MTRTGEKAIILYGARFAGDGNLLLKRLLYEQGRKRAVLFVFMHAKDDGSTRYRYSARCGGGVASDREPDKPLTASEVEGIVSFALACLQLPQDEFYRDIYKTMSIGREGESCVLPNDCRGEALWRT